MIAKRHPRFAIALAALGALGCASAPVRRVAVRAAPAPAPAPVDPVEAALARALHEHRPAEPPTLVEGRLTLPDDWKTLPQAAVENRITYRVDGAHLVAVGDTIVARAPEELLGIDVASGDVRWARTVEGDLVRGCGVVATIEPEVVRGLDPETGAVVWEQELLDGERALELAHGACHLIFRAFHPTRPGVLRFRAVDTRDGTFSAFTECDQYCDVVSTSAQGLVWLDREGATTHVTLDGTATALPPNSQALVRSRGGQVALVQERGRWRGMRPGGEVVWRREEPSQLLGRFGEWALMLSEHALLRLDLTSGGVTWRLPLGPRLERTVSRHSVVYDGARLVVAWGSHPCALLEIDAGTGAPLSFRVLQESPLSTQLLGERAIIGSESGIWVVDLEHEVAPVRDTLPLEEDLARGIDRLFGPEAGDGPSLLYTYPQGRRQAMGWLIALGPLARPALLARAETATLPECVRIASALRDAPPRELTPLLLRSLVPLTEEGAVALRLAVAGSLPSGVILPPELGPPLAENAVEWLETARAEGALTTDRYALCRSREMVDTDQCTRAYEVARALASTRAILGSAFASAAPLRTLRAAIAGGQAPGDPCTPSGDDAVRAAVLTHLLELSPRPVGAVIAEGAQCVPLITHRGPVTVVADASDPPTPWWRIGPPLPVDERPVQWNESTWDSAPMRRVEVQFHAGPLEAAGTEVFLVELDGVWRVVFERRRWIS